MKVRRGHSTKFARFTALMLAVALVLSNVGAGMLWNVYAEELAETQQEPEQKPIQLTTAADENETTESLSEEPSGENVTAAPEENEPSGENSLAEENSPAEETPSEEPTEGSVVTLLSTEPEETDGSWWDSDEIMAIAATPSNAVKVTVVGEDGEGIAKVEPAGGEHEVSEGESFTLTVTPKEYYYVNVTAEPEAQFTSSIGEGNRSEYVFSDLTEDTTVTITAEYLSAVADYYAVEQKVYDCSEVTKENVEAARALYDELKSAYTNVISELNRTIGQKSSEGQRLINAHKAAEEAIKGKLESFWKGEAEYDGWYLIITHEVQDDDTVDPVVDYVYLEKEADSNGGELVKRDASKLLAHVHAEYFEGKKYKDNNIGVNSTLSLSSNYGGDVSSPAKVTFYYVDETIESGEGWYYSSEDQTLYLTGDVLTVGDAHPWKQLAIEGKIRKVCAPATNEKEITICAKAFQAHPYNNATYGIKEIELHKVKSIGEGAFGALQGLEKVTLEDIGTVGCGAFASGFILETVELTNVGQLGDFAEDESKDNSDGVFSGCVRLKNAKLTNVGTIGTRSFYGCKSLATLSMTGVEKIGTEAFYNAVVDLQEVTIPETCNFIGANAFTVEASRLGKGFVWPDVVEDLHITILNENMTLGYSNVFSLMPELIARMENLSEKTFKLNPITTPELTVSEDWTDSKVGNSNSTEPNTTQVTKAARWADDSKTKAEIELQFSHSATPGKDILFLLDYSRSIAYPADYKDSKLYNIQFKAIDLIEDLFDDGYDNRVGIITFSSGTGIGDEIGFTDSKEELLYFVSHSASYMKGTDYVSAFNSAYDLIDGRNDKSREVKIIFISDGVPYDSNGPMEYAGDIVTAVERVKAMPNVDVFSVLQAGTSTPTKEIETMQRIANGEKHYFLATDTKSFNDAVNAAIAAAYGTFTVTDTVGADFDLDMASVVARSYDEDGKATVLSDEMLSSVTFTKDADGNDVITWELPALANTRYMLTFTENLKPDDAGKYPAGTFDTNTGDAEVKPLGANEAVNTVETPKLSRNNSYGITVHYLEKDTNETLAEDGTYSGSENEAYDISDLLNRQIEGYQLAEGQELQAQGTLTEDIVINVYYVKNPEPTNPEPTNPEPTNPNPPSGGGNPGGTTPTNPTNPVGPTEIPDNETPLGPAPIQIEDAAVPLADGVLVAIEDEDVPLTDAPQTGDNRPIGAVALLAVLALGLMGMFGSLGFRKKDAE